MKKFITLVWMLTALCGVSMADTYTVVGGNATIFGEDWNPSLTSNDLTYVSENKYQKKYNGITLSAGSFQYKFVTNHNWSAQGGGTEYPLNGNNSAAIPYSGTYDITFELDLSTSTGTCTLELKNITQSKIHLIYDAGPGWKVGEEINYDAETESFSIEYEGKKGTFIGFSTEDLTTGANYTTWNSFIYPIANGNYSVYIEHMSGSTQANNGSAWKLEEDATYTFTLIPSSKTFSIDAKKIVTVTSAGWATFSLGEDGNNRGYTVTGADAFYIASTPSTDKATLTPIASGAKIPTYPDGIILKKIGGGEVTINTTATSNVTLTGNKLQGSGRYTDWKIDNYDYTGYVLANKTEGIGFYPVDTDGSDITLAAYKAFLKIPNSAAHAFDFIGLGDESTGIKAIDNEQMTMDNVYDLSGRKIVNGKSVNGKLQSGLYIVNGKKVIIK